MWAYRGAVFSRHLCLLPSSLRAPGAPGDDRRSVIGATP